MELITRADLAKKLNISVPTIMKFESEGMPVIRQGGVIRYDWEDVFAWMKREGK